MLRAGFYAHSAAYAFCCAYVGDTVGYANGVALAHRSAVSVAETAERTFSRSAVYEVCRSTAFYAVIYLFFLRRFAIAAATDKRNFFNYVCKIDTKHFGKLFCNGIGTGKSESSSAAESSVADVSAK